MTFEISLVALSIFVLNCKFLHYFKLGLSSGRLSGGLSIFTSNQNLGTVSEVAHSITEQLYVIHTFWGC